MDQVNEKAAFGDYDFFARKQYAKINMQLIENHSVQNGTCTIAINAPYDVDKSTFLHLY